MEDNLSVRVIIEPEALDRPSADNPKASSYSYSLSSSSSIATFGSHDQDPYDRCPHDVFLSFRGEDTRTTFTDHLYTAFVNAGFRTFRDDNYIRRGESIKPELHKAIQESKSSVIVLSENYASSSWCLDELVAILERKNTPDSRYVVFPVFYHVTPSQVRKQTESYAEAFAAHQKTESLAANKVNGWSSALTEVADIAGMVLKDQDAGGYEAQFINKIVKVIADKISRKPLSVPTHLIGIENQVADIKLWLQDESDEAGIFAICGMRGIGKTTMAKSVYNSSFQSFERSSFLENIKETSDEQPNGLVRLQNQLLRDILEGRKVKVNNQSEGTAEIEHAISSKKILLVLDDVDALNQLEALLGNQGNFHRGTKIIITTSNTSLLRLSQPRVSKVHEVQTMNYDESMKLFSRYAFGQNDPIYLYMELAKKVVQQCQGLPLALKVLGSSLAGQSIDVWKSAMEKLEAIPNCEVMDKLKISYHSLQDNHDQKLFLHIACFFVGMDTHVINKILDGCGFYTVVGIQNLIDRCLVTTEGYKVQMHGMIRDMGRGIVRLESEDPRQRSRLWHHSDSLQVLTENKGTEKTEGLALNMHMDCAYDFSRNPNGPILETNAFAKMPELKLVQLSHVQLRGHYENFPTGLRWLSWHECHLQFLPNDFSFKSLVVIEMCYGNMSRAWMRTKKSYFPSLKILNLSHSHSLIETPDFSSAPNVELLILRDCGSLVDVHKSIGNLEKLVELNMEDCKNVRKLPDISRLKLLERLIISGCTNLNEFPMDMKTLKSLKVFQADGVSLHRLLCSTKTSSSSGWNFVNMFGKSKAEKKHAELLRPKIPENFWNCYLPSTLEELSLGQCNLIDDDFPRAFQNNLSLLKILDLSGNPLSTLPSCIGALTNLCTVSFSECTLLMSLVGLPEVRKRIIIRGCTSLQKMAYQSESSVPRDIVIGSNWNLVQLQCCFKLAPINQRDDGEMIDLLELTNWEAMEIIMDTTHEALANAETVRTMQPIQGLYETGIFSTFLPGDQIPKPFIHCMHGFSVSFTVSSFPSSKIQGLNVFSVYAKSDDDPSSWFHHDLPRPIMGVVKNNTKRWSWKYCPLYLGIPSREVSEVTWSSHWKFGSRMLKAGDKLEFTVLTKPEYCVRKCGIQIVYEHEERRKSTKDDDPFYPNVIAGDASIYGYNNWYGTRGTCFITHSTPGPTADYVTNHLAPEFNYLLRRTS